MKNKFLIRSKAVFTGCADIPEAATVAIADGKIVAVLPWNYDNALNCAKDLKDGNGCTLNGNAVGAYADWELFDYGDRLVMPSFIDAHTHIFSGAINASDYVCDDLGKGKSQEECAQIMADFAEAHPNQKRLRGAGWFVANWENPTLPDKRSLDALIPDRPVYLQCADAHSFWLNSKAIEECGIDPDLELDNGIICKFPDGELTGLLLEPAAYAPADAKYMEFSPEEMVDIHRTFQRILAKNGVAGASEMFAMDYTKEAYEQYDVLKRLDEEGGLSADIYVYTKLFGYTDFTPYFEMQKQYQTPHFHIAGLKGFVDGVTETHTGMLLEPYTDCPDTCGDNTPLWPREKMKAEIAAANRAGIQVRLHCIADGSVRMALDLYEASEQENGKSDVRNTIEHIENIHPDDLDRFAQLNVIPSMQPYHLILSNNGKVNQIGEERCRYEWAMRTILEHGGKLAFGTDYPVVGLNPFETVYAALTRKDANGVQSGRNPWETLPLDVILKAYTIGAAYVYHSEQETGTIEAGKRANLIVIDRNLFAVEPEEIRKASVDVNIFDGRLIYMK